MKIVIHKSTRILECISGDSVLFSADISLGSAADDGPKLREGDGRTPEGEYVISSRNPESKYHLSLGISYPGTHDARRGLANGVISRAEFDLILADPSRPPWNTPMGGFIMIHGEHPSGLSGDWTAGCVAVKNEVMDRLFSLCGVGDGVTILP